MSDLRELYQEVILDHNKQPRNFRTIEGVPSAEGYNPLCGDKVTIYLDLEGDQVKDIAFQGAGCAISQASASLMTEAVQGKTRAEAEDLFNRFRHMLTGDGQGEGEGSEGLDKLEVFSGVRQYPMRVKCATLAWHTLKSALEGQARTPVTTE